MFYFFAIIYISLCVWIAVAEGRDSNSIGFALLAFFVSLIATPLLGWIFFRLF